MVIVSECSHISKYKIVFIKKTTKTKQLHQILQVKDVKILEYSSYFKIEAEKEIRMRKHEYTEKCSSHFTTTKLEKKNA